LTVRTDAGEMPTDQISDMAISDMAAAVRAVCVGPRTPVPVRPLILISGQSYYRQRDGSATGVAGWAGPTAALVT
jgi:hypothetical protein